MRKLLLIGAIVLTFFCANVAGATGWKCPPGQEKKGWKCVPIVEPSDPGMTVNNNNDNRNTNVNTAFGGNADATATATATSDVDVDIDNKNVNKNTLRQGQGQGQDQLQGQLQGQGQDQSMGQSQSADNKGNTQTLNQTIEAPKRTYNHAAIVDGADTDASIDADLGNFSYKVMGSVMSKIEFITYKQAKRLGKDTSDYDIEEALLFESEFRTTTLNKGIPVDGIYMGSLYIMPTGSDVTVAGLEGRIAAAAMKFGASHAIFIYDSGAVASGSDVSFKIGGGASQVVGDSGKTVVNSGGGIGWSKASAFNEEIPAIVVELYVSDSLK